MKEKVVYMVDRDFCEKLIALTNHVTRPAMDIFQADMKVKKRVVIDYDPQAPKVKFTFYSEDMNSQDGGESHATV